MESLHVIGTAILVGAPLLWVCKWLYDRLRTAELQAEMLAESDEQARDELSQLQAGQRMVGRFLREFPQLVQELHPGVNARHVPDMILTFVNRILEPDQTLVLFRRRATESDPQRASRLVVAARTPSSSLVELGTEVMWGRGAIGYVAEAQRVLDRTDLDSTPALLRAAPKQDRLPGFQLDLAAPMVSGGETIGVIALMRSQKPSSEAKDILRLIAQSAAVSVRNVRAFRDMKTAADLDGLTRIPNKRYMTELLGEELLRARERGSCLSIFLFDIDNFKHYNDTNGHTEGDRLLRQLARLVAENSRRENPVGRVGGEEFLIVFPEVPSDEALLAAEKLRGLIASHPFPFADRQPLGRLSVSGGVAEFPRHGESSTDLLRLADEALYSAKKQGRDRVLAATPR